MKKDIEIPKVENVAVAVVPEVEKGIKIWRAYLVNFSDNHLEGVLVNSKGYGLKDGEQVKTSVLRHFLDEMPPKSAKRIEQVTDELRGLSNEFWVSFYLNKKMYDKKYVFLAESIAEQNLSQIDVLGAKGVLIK